MNPPRRRLLALLGTSLALSACSSVGDALRNAPRPTITVAGVRLDGLDLEQVRLAFDLDVANPYPVALPVSSLDYTLTVGGHPLLQGSATAPEPLPARGSGRVSVPVSVPFQALRAALGTVVPGSVLAYRADFRIGITAPLLGPLTLPLSHSGELPVPAVPDVSLEGFEVDSLGAEQVQAHLRLRVRNTNGFDLDLGRLALGLSLGGRRVVDAGLASAGHLAPGQEVQFDLPVAFSPRALGGGLLRLLRGGGADYAIDGRVDATTRFGPLSLPFTHSGSTPVGVR